MKRFLLALLPLLALPVAAETCPSTVAADQKGPVPLCLVVTQVKSALQRYQASLGTNKDALPLLSKAVFDLKTTAATTIGGKVGLFIVTIGGSHEKAVTNEVTFTYAPHKATAGVLAPRTPVTLDDQLYATIRGAAEQIRMAETVGDLPFSSLAVTVQFCVKWNANGGIHAPISLITVGLDGDKSRDVTQSITLTFARP